MTPLDTSGAIFDRTGVYRYRLWRYWDDKGYVCCFILLNPSTADENKNDPTVTRCIKYARRWGHRGLEVVNIFALRSTDPKALRGHPDPVGSQNDAAIQDAVEKSKGGIVVAAWGAHGSLRDRARTVVDLVGRATLHCLGVTKDGQPRHPLYLRSDAKPSCYTPPLGRTR